MLRLLIGSGLLLMAVGFGAAGVQYWRGLPADTSSPDTSDAGTAALQTWLVTPTGALVSRDDLRAYLTQDRFVPGRMATVVLTAPLTSLLAEGESLPATPFLQVFADIRAPMLAGELCPVLRTAFTQGCAVHSARVVDGSVDVARGTARFEVELAYRQAPEPEALPDLATHVFASRTIDWQAEAGSPEAATADTALAAVAQAGLAACTVAETAPACRIMALTLDWAPGIAATGQARVGWLAPIPDGMIIAPSLTPTPEN